MTLLLGIVAVACLGLLITGIAEQRNHLRTLRTIPIRILVNGSRGKSSITRLCAGALRGGGLVVVAKTTGTAARLIYPDATEEPLHRKLGLPNVIEQLPVVRRAAAFFPDVLVVECMAVSPDLQELSQTKLIQSTIGIVSNVRDDHLAEMGRTPERIARSLSRSMPHGRVCFTAERDQVAVLRAEAAKRECQLIEVDPDTVSDDDLAGFAWLTFRENVAIALAVAQSLGVDRQSALKGMWATPPDPGAVGCIDYAIDGRRLRVANIFAANDPASTMMNIEQLRNAGAVTTPFSLVINCRPDRIERNGQMGALVPRLDPARTFLIGHPTRSARASIPRQWQASIVDLGGDRTAQEVVAGILPHLDESAMLIAVGNIHGQGERLLAHLSQYLEAP